MDDDSAVICRRQGAAGRITLNRPKALNALTRDMCVMMTDALFRWRDDPAVQCVVIDGAGDRAFCAGADIKGLHALGQAGRVEEAWAFFRDEYRLNRLIKRYPKPYVALIDGVTMGGGVGLSVHAARCVATERTVWAMPETAIGLFPDVGLTYALPRLPACAGMWLGLTGARLGAGEAFALGLVTDIAGAGSIADLTEALEADGIAALPDRPARPDLTADWEARVGRPFGGETLQDILTALDRRGTEWDAQQAAAIRAASPTSLAITFEALRRGADLRFEDCLVQEMRLAARCMEGRDFYEGVRAQVIDKDRAPKWSPESLDALSEAEIASYFRPLTPEWDLDLQTSTG